MGICSSAPLDDESKQSRDLEIEGIEARLKQLWTFKIILLGAGESGKSTIYRQLQILHNKSYSMPPLDATHTLQENLIDCLKSMIQFGEKVEQKFNPAHEETVQFIMNFNKWQERLTMEDAESIKAFFESAEAQAVYARRSEYWILDSFEYYMTHLMRFCAEDFVPTEEDHVMMRVRTTGIVSTTLTQKIVQEAPIEPEALNYQLIDVGGQRNERKKWIHHFADVKCVLFVVNLAGYKQILFEEDGVNRMDEALGLFEKTISNPAFKGTPIFLFLNKKDLFEKMIQAEDLSLTFPDYDGGKNVQRAIAYIGEKFKAKVPPGTAIHIKDVSAAVKSDVRANFNSVKKVLYDDNKKELIAQATQLTKEMNRLKK